MPLFAVVGGTDVLVCPVLGMSVKDISSEKKGTKISLTQP